MEKQIALDMNLAEGLGRYFDELFASLESHPEDKYSERELSDEEVNALSRQILSLSDTGRELFYGRYCFLMSDEAMHVMFGTAFPAGRLRYYKAILSSSHNLPDGEVISERAFKKAAGIALDMDMELTEKEANGQKIISLPRGARSVILKISKGVAAAIVIFAVGLTTAMTVNAEFREKVVNWFIETFAEFSIFNTTSEKEITIEDLRAYHPTYIPERYQHIDTVESPVGITYTYADEQGYILYIDISFPNIDAGINTENMEIRKLEYRGEEAYMMFDSENGGTFAFVLDGTPVYIGGMMNENEAMAIADGIEKR